MHFRIALATLLIVPVICPQSPDMRPQFDAASIKLNVNCAGRRGRGTGPRTLEYYAPPCVSVRTLIQFAYSKHIPNIFRPTAVLGGAAWLDTELYDVAAKGYTGSLDRWRAMLQRLLEDRCNLKIHRETRDVPVYEMTVAKGGPKIGPPKPGSCLPVALDPAADPGTTPPPQPVTDAQAAPPCFWTSYLVKDGIATVTGLGVTMDQLATGMLDRLDRLVVNRTGLAGIFYIHLEYAPEPAPTALLALGGLDSTAPVPSAPDPKGPSVFTAVEQQLGLKLIPRRGNVEVLVIDHVEKPSDN